MTGPSATPTGAPAAALPELGLPELGLPELTESWLTIWQKDLRDDTLSRGVRGFARHAEDRLARMATELAKGRWHAGRLTPVRIPKHHGGQRVLHIPSVPDRIVETTLLRLLTPRIDPLLSPYAMAYRPGLGVADAVDRLTKLRARGRRWVLRCDIADCFPSIDRTRAQRLTLPLLPAPLHDVLLQLLNRRSWDPTDSTLTARGLPQGAPLSPILANFVLTELDDELSDSGHQFIRYSDDIAVCCHTPEHAHHALNVITRRLEAMGMTLGAESTAIMSFDDGFAFLGEDFGPKYPPTVSSFKTAPELERTLYVARPGCRVHVEQGRVRVDIDDTRLLDVPTGHVARIVLFGAAGLSAGARAWALSTGVDVALCSQRGTYLGQLLPATGRVTRRLQQADLRHDTSWRLDLGRALIAGKLRHQITALHRFTHTDTADTVASATAAIRRLLAMLPDCTTRSEIMGLEGAAARAYFDCWPDLLPPGLTFPGRNRHPPRDTVNAALSWAYTVLHSETVTALAGAGLDPCVGVLHDSEEHQFSLANDLMEEFRPLIADDAILTLARARELTDGHARHDGEAVLLTAEGRQRVAAAYEHRMTTLANGAATDFHGSYRRLLHHQAHQLARCIDHHDPTWTALAWR